MNSATATASPSLALIKYWGKSDTEKNLPATSSLAITLEGLETTTTVERSNSDQVFINRIEADPKRYASFFEHFRQSTNTNAFFLAHSTANFPISAGVASSSSGFAALAYGLALLTDPSTPLQKISEYARIGSASAARSIYGGFTILKKDGSHAQPLNIEWPELRIVIAIVSDKQKPVSSRKAMELSRTTSPFYSKWLEESESHFSQSVEAAAKKDLKKLGPLIRQSYLSMFSTMFTSSPPTFYWLPQSISLIRTCEELRQKGVEVWETMDAGPQVKMICLENDLKKLMKTLHEKFPRLTFIVSKPGELPNDENYCPGKPSFIR